jgi:hypothetical protein
MNRQGNVLSWITAAVSGLFLIPLGNAQTQVPAMNNRIGDITNNQGIITQGQIGDNTIVNPIRRETNGVYQGDQKVGNGPPPVIDEVTGFAIFPMIGFTTYPDPTRPLEYGNLLLSSEDVPRPRPNTFTASVSIAIAGFKAQILGRR